MTYAEIEGNVNNGDQWKMDIHFIIAVMQKMLAKAIMVRKFIRLLLRKIFQQWIQATMVDVEEEQGVLLYDVQQKEDGLCFLYVQNYMTDNNLVLKKVGNLRN